MRARSSRLVAPASVLILVPVLAFELGAGACDHHTVVGRDLNPGQGGSSAPVPCVLGKTLSLPLRDDESIVAVTIGDWNGDGRGDLATVDRAAGTVGVWLANGIGTYGRTEYPTGAGPRDLVQGDWNGDHALDLATANYTDNSVSVLFGRGDGTFAQASRQATETSPVTLGSGDLNGDGHTDLVSGNIAGTISVWLGSLAGLGTRQDQPGPHFDISASSIVMGDFDGNGTMDLVAGSSGPGSQILLGDGAGQFTAPQRMGHGGVIAAADFNQDGHLDLGVADPGGRGWTGSLGLMQGTGNGSFSGETVLMSKGSSAVQAGDLNRDGYADLAATTYDQLNVWHGDEHGLSETYETYPVGGSIMAMGDLNCDGVPDLAIASWSFVSVLFADAGGF
jgi:hypothetical protein